MIEAQLHRAQIKVLNTLRHTTTARYSQLRAASGMESDAFKFHLRSLQKAQLVQKLEDGSYSLTPQGNEFANNLDEAKRKVQKQPKLTTRIVVARTSASGETEYLLQERLRRPYWGFWGCIGGPVQWGQSFEATAAAELKKQANLEATFEVVSFYRKRDYDESSGDLLEDKLFAILRASDVRGELESNWEYGANAWMTLDALKKQEKYFISTVAMVEAAEGGPFYITEDAQYTEDEY